MKIIFCLNHFLPHHTAGTEVYVVSLSKQLLKKGYNVYVLIPNYNSFDTEEYLYDEIKVIKYAEPTVLDKEIILGRKNPDGLPNFINIVNSIQPNIIHFHVIGGSNGIGISHLNAVKSLKFTVVTTFHIAGYSCFTNNLMYKDSIACNGIININKCTSCVLHSKGLKDINLFLVSNLANAMFKLNYNSIGWGKSIGTALAHPFLIESLKNKLIQITELSSRVIVLTDWYKKCLIQNGVSVNKLKLIKQGLPSNKLNLNLDSKSNIIRFIFIGRITFPKGLHLILEAFKNLPYGSISLSIYGPEIEEDYVMLCKNLAKDLNVQWYGTVPPNEIVSILSNHNCLIVPSIICEMSPLVIQEAFAACIPVLASNVMGNAEQIENGINGWLFEFNSNIDLKDKILNILNNPLLLKTAKNNIKPLRLFNDVTEDHISLYKEIFSE